MDGNEILQEVLSKQLYTCQCLMALQIVRPLGHFVTKVFDLFTLYSVGLVYLMYQCFERSKWIHLVILFFYYTYFYKVSNFTIPFPFICTYIQLLKS